MAVGKMKDGLIERAPGSWAYVIRVTDQATGKRKPKWYGGYPTRKAAKEARDSARHATNRGTYVERENTTLIEWLTTWLDVHTGEIRPSTADSYRRLIRLYVKPYPIAHERLQALTPMMLSAHWRTVRESGGQGGKPLSARTVRYTHTVVFSALAAALTNRHLEVNPATGVKLPKEQKVEASDPDAWAPDELRTFLTATAEQRLAPLWILMAYTGMRRGEALALRWADIDLDGGTARIARAVADDGHALYFSAPKNGEGRIVPLSGPVVDALRSWRKTQAAEKLAAGPEYADPGTEPLLFTMPDGRQVNPVYASKVFTRSVKDADVPKLTLHGLRHTCATLLLRDGHPVHLVARLLGHKDISVTLNTYSHAIPQDQTTLSDAMERIVTG